MIKGSIGAQIDFLGWREPTQVRLLSPRGIWQPCNL